MKTKLILLVLIICILCVGCQEENKKVESENSSNYSAKETEISSNEIYDDYETIRDETVYLDSNSTEAVSEIMDVIQNKDKFIFGKKNKSISIEEYCIDNYSYILKEKNCYKNSNIDLSNFFTNFCVIDLDNDGECEVILEDGTGTRLVFHYDESVYAYDFNFRGMKNIKEDGTFESSDSAAVTEILKIKFVNGKYEYEEVCIRDGLDLDNPIYKINGEDATKEQVNHFLEEQNEKEDAVWYRFNESLNPYILR